MITRPLLSPVVVEPLPPCTVCGVAQLPGSGGYILVGKGPHPAHICCPSCNDSRKLGCCPICHLVLEWDIVAEQAGRSRIENAPHLSRLVCAMGHRYRIEYGEILAPEEE